MNTLLLLAMALPALMPNNATLEKQKPGLSGIWQQVEKSKSEGKLIKLPVWKILQNDGTFNTFLIANQYGKSVITNEGRYVQTSDSTYVEHITGSITDPDLVGKDNAITYHFVSADHLEITYRLPDSSVLDHESWIRVKLELPEETRYSTIE